MKDYLPEGISEQEFVDIVRKVSLKSAIKYKFGYHEVEDLIQRSYEMAIQWLKEGRFKPRGTKPMDLQLTNFLRVWIFNRLNNYRRDNSCRYPNKGGANQTKYNLMHAIPIVSQGWTNSEIFARDTDIVGKTSMRDITERLLGGFKKTERKLYDRQIAGETLSKEEFSKLEKAIRRILPGESQEYI